jgi:hypothetical protein
MSWTATTSKNQASSKTAGTTLTLASITFTSTATYSAPARSATSAPLSGSTSFAASAAFSIPARSATVARSCGAAALTAGATFTAPSRTASGAAATGRCAASAVARARARVGFTRIGFAQSSGTGGTALSYSPRADSYLLVLIATRGSTYPGQGPDITFDVANETQLTLLQETGSSGALISQYGGAAAGDETFAITLDPSDATASILVLEYAYNQQANLITALSTFATGNNPDLTQYTSVITPDGDGELALAIVMYPDPNIASLSAGDGWSNYLEIAPGSGFCRVGVEEIPQALASQSYTAAFSTSGASGHAWNGMWLLLSSPASARTYSGSASGTAGLAVVSSNATFRPKFTAASANTIGSIRASASCTCTVPIFAAVTSWQLGDIVAAAAGATTTPIFSAAALGIIGSCRASAAGAMATPVNSAGAPFPIGRVSFSAVATSVTPVFTLDAALTIRGASVSSVGAFAAQIFSAAGHVSSGAARAVAVGTIVAPRVTGGLNMTLAAVQGTAGATFDSGTFEIDAELNVSAALIVADAHFQPPVFGAVLDGILPLIQASATAVFRPPRCFNPAWASASRVLVSHA